MKRSLAITTPGDLRVERRQLVLRQGSETVATAPLEDLGMIVVDTAETRWTGALLAECGEHGIAVVFCGEKHLPATVCLPFVGHFLMAKHWRLQLDASLPRRKRLWQAIVRAKIQNQGDTLRKWTGQDQGLLRLANAVRSGDPDNLEATAAARYFNTLFGDRFVRARGVRAVPDDPTDLDPTADFAINARLNYGYAVLRAMVARAALLAGLHPTMGIWHRNQYNAFALADDLMEPLRPVVDELVIESLTDFPDEVDLTPPLKRHLLRVLTREVGWEGSRYVVDVALERFCAQCRDALGGQLETVSCPTG